MEKAPSEEIHGLYRSPNIVRVTESVVKMKGRSAFKILTDNPIGKRHLGKPRRRWEDNIRVDLK